MLLLRPFGVGLDRGGFRAHRPQERRRHVELQRRGAECEHATVAVPARGRLQRDRGVPAPYPSAGRRLHDRESSAGAHLLDDRPKPPHADRLLDHFVGGRCRVVRTQIGKDRCRVARHLLVVVTHQLTKLGCATEIAQLCARVERVEGRHILKRCAGKKIDRVAGVAGSDQRLQAATQHEEGQ